MPRCLALFAVAACAFAQDPYKLLPHNYAVELDNQSVRISRVKYLPGDRLPEHSHPSNPTVYVYLTDAGPIRFVHKTPKFEIERPAVKAGGVRFNRNAQVETHEVEYRGHEPSEYLRIELKTVPGPQHRDARLRTDADFPWSDPQLRISRVREALPALSRPSVLVDIAGRAFTWFDPARGSAAPAAGPGPTIVLELLTDAPAR